MGNHITMQTNDYGIRIVTLNYIIGYKLLVLDKNTLKNTSFCKLFVSDGNTLYHNCV